MISNNQKNRWIGRVQVPTVVEYVWESKSWITL